MSDEHDRFEEFDREESAMIGMALMDLADKAVAGLLPMSPEKLANDLPTITGMVNEIADHLGTDRKYSDEDVEDGVNMLRGRSAVESLLSGIFSFPEAD